MAAGLNRKGLVVPVKGAGRQIDVAALDGAGDLIDSNGPGGQGLGIELETDGIFLGAIDQDLGHSADHGNTLGHDGLPVFIDAVEGEERRIQRQVNHRLIGRVDLAIKWRGRHALGKQAGGPGDRRLDILGRGIDIPIQGELEGDLGEPQGIGGVHGIQTGDGGKLFFQGGGHGRGHGFRSGTGQLGGDQDGRKVHIGQVTHRQPQVAHDPEEQDAHHDQRSHDGSADKGLREVKPPQSAGGGRGVFRKQGFLIHLQKSLSFPQHSGDPQAAPFQGRGGPFAFQLTFYLNFGPGNKLKLAVGYHFFPRLQTLSLLRSGH